MADDMVQCFYSDFYKFDQTISEGNNNEIWFVIQKNMNENEYLNFRTTRNYYQLVGGGYSLIKNNFMSINPETGNKEDFPDELIAEIKTKLKNPESYWDFKRRDAFTFTNIFSRNPKKLYIMRSGFSIYYNRILYHICVDIIDNVFRNKTVLSEIIANICGNIE